MIDFNDLQNVTVGRWLELWFNTYKQPYLRPHSVRNIEQIIRLHTPSWLKDIPLINVTVLHIDLALAEITGSRTKIYARQVWHSAFLKALKLDIIPRNVVALTDSIRYKKQRGKALTIDEQQQLLFALEDKRIKWLILFYLFTGVRRSEALNLRWSDINTSQRLILIRGTKTEDSFRHIFLTEQVEEILRCQRLQSSNFSEKIFNYNPSYVSQAFRKICPNHRLHDLRHTYITRCAECGVNVSVCQQLVGHSTPQMTLSVYTHVLDDFKRKEASKFSINPYQN